MVEPLAQNLVSVGMTPPKAELLGDRTVQVVARDNTTGSITGTTETAILLETLEAGVMEGKRGFRITTVGYYRNTASSPGSSTFTVKVKLGSSTLFTEAQTVTQSASDRAVMLNGTTHFTAVDAQTSGYQLALGAGGTASAGAGNTLFTASIVAGVDVSTEDNASDLALQVTVQHSQNSSFTVYFRRSTIVELL